MTNTYQPRPASKLAQAIARKLNAPVVVSHSQPFGDPDAQTVAHFSVVDHARPVRFLPKRFSGR